MTAALTLTYGSLNLTASPYLVPWGSDTGAPENEVIPLASFIQDGQVELSTRAGNRTIQFDVLIEAATLTLMATAEANLVAETEKVLNTLTVDWGDGAPASVYDIFRGQVTLARDDDGEIARLRRYTVTVRALPFTRSAAQVVSTPIAAGPTTTNLDTCAATTGWTGLVNGVSSSPAVVSGAVVVSQAAAWGLYTLSLTKTFAATTTSTKLLLVDWKPLVQGARLTATGDGVVLPLYAETASPTSGFVRTWFYVAAASLAVTKFETASNVPVNDDDAGAPARSLSIDNVAVTNVTPIVGTGRQQLRTLPLLGSARTKGALSVESPTAALGDDVMAYVFKADESTRGYVPSLGQFQSAGTTPTADTARVSGHKVSLGGSGITFTVPMALFPAGRYLLCVRAALFAPDDDDEPITYTASTVLGSNTIAPASGVSRVLGLSTAYSTHVLDVLMLPTSDLDPKTPASLKLVLSSVSSGVTLDEAWLFNTSIGSLIQVDCGTGSGAVGGAARRLFVEPPTVTSPRQRVRIGHSADRSDAFHPTSVDSWQFLEFNPPQVNALVVTPGATDAVVGVRYYPAHHTNATS